MHRWAHEAHVTLSSCHLALSCGHTCLLSLGFRGSSALSPSDVSADGLSPEMNTEVPAMVSQEGLKQQRSRSHLSLPRHDGKLHFIRLLSLLAAWASFLGLWASVTFPEGVLQSHHGARAGWFCLAVSSLKSRPHETKGRNRCWLVPLHPQCEMSGLKTHTFSAIQ